MTFYTSIFFILVSILISIYLSILITPKIRQYGIKRNILDRFEERKSNKVLKVRIGGVSLLFSFLITIIFIFFVLKQYIFLSPTEINYLTLIILGSILYSLIGLLDDIKSLSPFIRLIFQFLISIFIWYGGLRIESLNINIANILVSEIDLPSYMSILFTTVWIVGLINAFNWLDGLDGLSSSISVIISTTILIIGFVSNNNFLCLITSALIGSNIGFLKYNIYPSKIIMGDSGSYLIGFLLSVLGILSTYNLNNQTNLFLILSLFSLPIGDMVYVIMKRIVQRKSPFYPDRNHIHFRLIDKGYLETEAAKKIIQFCLINGLISLLIFFVTSENL